MKITDVMEFVRNQTNVITLPYFLFCTKNHGLAETFTDYPKKGEFSVDLNQFQLHSKHHRCHQ